MFFPKKRIYFSKKKPKFWTFWDFLLFQSHSTGNLLQFSEKKIPRSETWTNKHHFSVNAIGKHKVKNAQIAHLRGRFCFHVLDMEQNIEREIQLANHNAINQICQLKRLKNAKSRVNSQASLQTRSQKVTRYYQFFSRKDWSLDRLKRDSSNLFALPLRLVGSFNFTTA